MKGRVDLPGTSFTDTLSNGVTYNYEIRERTGQVNGDPINCGDAAATDPPPAGNLTCSLAVNATNVTITWTGDTNADAIIVFRTPTGANTSWRARATPPWHLVHRHPQQRRHLQLRNP
ncbi:MAG: hypothetical protein R2706_03580 [Acidimicrobiales bacterium]